MAEMKGITCCGDCVHYNWKKHKCSRGFNKEIDARSHFYDDCDLPKVKPIDEWISVKDRLPKTGEIILACNIAGDFEILSYYNEKFISFDENGYSYEVLYITHWMPLPEPPKGE